MERINVALQGFQQSFLPAVKAYWLENPRFAPDRSLTPEQPPLTPEQPTMPPDETPTSEQAAEAETVRFTVDMSKAMHQDLSLLAAKQGKKKVALVRLAIAQLLKDMKDDAVMQ